MIITRYLVTQVLKSQFAILLILSLIFVSRQLLIVLESAVDRNVPADLVLAVMSLGMPTMIELILPLSLFVALLMTLGRLYSESEITAMRACGVGQRVLIRVTLILSLFTASLAAFNSLWLSPWAIQTRIDLLEDAKANPGMGILAAGQFISAKRGEFVLFVDRVKNNRIQDIYLFQTESDKNAKPAVVVAETGELNMLPNGDQILTLKNTQRIEGSANLPDFRIAHFEQYQAYLEHKQSNSQREDIETKNLSQLLADNSNTAKIELLWRISLILAVPLMAMIATPLSRINPRQSRFVNMLPMLLIYLIFILSQNALRVSGFRYETSTYWVMALINLLFLLLGLILNGWNNGLLHKIRYLLLQKISD